jgi:hypothetical protein
LARLALLRIDAPPAVLLRLPSAHRPRSGEDIDYPPGTSGLWFLRSLGARAPAEANDEERREMWRCMRFASLASSPDNTPPIERIGIGADGTWHYFSN